MSKFSLDVLQKRVFPFTQSNDSDVILGAAFGEDVALTRVGGDILVSHVDPIVGAIGEIGWLAVHVACNDVAAAGIPPRWLLLLVLVPRL
jgi:hydrogenase maturation factor